MGNLCNKESQISSSSIDSEREINIISYKSTADKTYELQEGKFNFFRKINYKDFLYSLVNFSNENATLKDDYINVNINYSMNDSFFNESFDNDIFQSFLENKILKHKAINTDLLNNEKIVSIFKECFLGANSGLGLKLSQDVKMKGNSSANKNNIIKKGNCIGYGVLYCSGKNYIKIKSLFNLFQEDSLVKGILLQTVLARSYPRSVRGKNEGNYIVI